MPVHSSDLWSSCYLRREWRHNPSQLHDDVTNEYHDNTKNHAHCRDSCAFVWLNCVVEQSLSGIIKLPLKSCEYLPTLLFMLGAVLTALGELPVINLKYNSC